MPSTPTTTEVSTKPSAPRSGAWLSASIKPPAPSASVMAPSTSKPTSTRRVVSRNTRNAVTTGTIDSAAWMANIGRQPTASMSGPPMTRPIAGEPAATSDHQPMALARSAGAWTLLMSAIDDGIVAAPITTASPRRTINEYGSQANTVSAVTTVEIVNPVRNTRRWPYRSPSLPRIGSATADARSGPEITQAMSVSVVPKSSAIVGSETASSVTGKVVANMPVSAVSRTQRWYRPDSVRRAWTRSRRSLLARGTPGTRSTLPASR